VRIREGTFQALLLAAVAGSSGAAAEVVLDGTLGPTGALLGPDFEISAALGRTEGANLFHSFERFSLQAGESATFSGPAGIANVITRVTGGARSDINGALRSTIPGADLFFLNPAGVVFGPNATLDVGGSFHVSTADELRFADGAIFSASNPDASSFTAAAPEAFGFLGAEPGDLAVDRSRLSVPAGEALSLVGGDLTVTAGTIRAETGEITLAALGGPGAVAVADGGIAAETGADILVTDQAVVDASGDGAGTVRVRGGRLVVENRSSIRANNTGPTDARRGIDAVELDVGLLELQDRALVTTATRGAGAAGDLTIKVDRLVLNDSDLAAGTFGPGAGADLTVVADEALLDASGVFADSSGTGPDAGAGGNITLDVGHLELQRGAVVTTSTFGPGAGGDLTIMAKALRAESSRLLARTNGRVPGSGAGGRLTLHVGQLELHGSDAAAGTFGPGAGGNLTVMADQALLDASGLFATSEGTGPDAGAGGNIRLDVHQLELQRSLVTTTTFGPGTGGDLTVVAEALRAERSFLFARTSGRVPGSGVGGKLTLDVGQLELHDSEVAAGTFGPGAGGDLKVVADEALLDASGLLATSEGTGPDAGAGGNITFDVGQLELHGSSAAAGTFGPGAGGDLTVLADAFHAAGERSGLFASSDDPGPQGGRVGTIRLGARTISLADGASVATARAGGRADDPETGTAGAHRGGITIEAMDTLRLSGDASITAETGIADAGDIEITAGQLIDLEDSAITTSVAGGRGGGGNIRIDPRFVVLDNSRIVANAFEGAGGNISIAADSFLRSPDSVVDASSQLGLPGTVAITVPEVDVASGLVSPQAEFLDPSALLRERCEERRTTGASSFTGVGRGGVELSPDAPLPAFSSDLAKAPEFAGAAGEARKWLTMRTPPAPGAWSTECGGKG
jgi:filamentous hemagglutinin family protein